jgi:hypothetical protein
VPQATYPSPARAAPKDSYLVLLRVGFSMPQTVTSCAVRSYRTISHLPVSEYDHRRSLLCCTFRRLAPPRSYLALCPMEPGLSSPVNPIPPKEISRKTAVAAQPTPRIDYHEIISCLKIIFIKISLKVAKKFSRLIYCLRERAKAYNSFFW